MRYLNLLIFLFVIFVIQEIYCEIFSELQIKNETNCEVIITTYCAMQKQIKGTEIIIPKYGEAVIEGIYRFFGCNPYVGWSEDAIIIIRIENQQIGPIKACSIFSDFEVIGSIVKIKNKFYLNIENEGRLIPSHNIYEGIDEK
ncbi:MAG: hypothetical protein P4L22_06685 [Candidatus Babeliales bacterium]|nr:hypothetical protein [Candidatus Babeliales bacterium]